MADQIGERANDYKGSIFDVVGDIVQNVPKSSIPRIDQDQNYLAIF
jgi:hypothetical protein